MRHRRVVNTGWLLLLLNSRKRHREGDLLVRIELQSNLALLLS